MSKKVLVAMSGGVDSSVAAYKLKLEGYECFGVTLRLYGHEDKGTVLSDTDYAGLAAERLGMTYSVYDYEECFREKVIEDFVHAYERGATPNPCIECNRHVKFKKLFDIAYEKGFDKVATGHYARTMYDEGRGRYLLLKAADDKKDQSYVLYSLTQEQLQHISFPLGGLTKPEVRSIAEEQGFINADRRDSQDICFIPDGDYADFIEKYTGREYPDGEFVSRRGELLGRHRGIIRYTIGQRRGLGLALPRPMYVCDKDVDKNQVILGIDDDLYSRELEADNINLISADKIEGEMRVKAKTRYSHREQWATVRQIAEDRIWLVFDEPQRAITKGQSVVMYDGEIVVGGGRICGLSLN